MAKEVIMPALGMSQETGRLLAWLKKAGEPVVKGEPLMEVETDKTTVEVEAPASGTLGGVTVQAGTDVPVGEVIAYILAAGERTPVVPAKPAVPSVPPRDEHTLTVGSAFVSVTPVAQRMAAAHNLDLSQVPARGERITRADVEAYLDNGDLSKVVAPTTNSVVLASPKARRLADERGMILAEIPGSGPEGAVLAADVLNFIPATQPVATSASGAVQTGTMWKRMAQRLTESWQQIPHFYLKREVDASAFVAWRTGLKARSEVKITYTDLLVKAVAYALRASPYVNGMWNGEGVVFNEEVNVGLAVAVEQGLLVPVIHNTDKLGVREIAARRAEIVERSLSGKLKPDDLQGGTFTISNLGMFGIDDFNAIVNPPQAAILAVGTISERAVPVNGEITVKPMMTLSLSCDHRAVDGAHGAQFLDSLARAMEAPLSLLD